MAKKATGKPGSGKTEQATSGKLHLAWMDDAKRAIDKVFSDTSVDQFTTNESLDELIGYIEEKQASLD